MSLEETIVTAPLLHQEKGNIPVLKKSFIYIWLHHIKIIMCLIAVFVQVRLKPFCCCPSLLTPRNTSSERPSDLDSVKFTDELQALQNTLMPLWIHLLKQKIWNELDSFSTRSRCSKAFWCQLTEAANEEGWRASGGPFETGAPRLSREEAWYPSQLICVAKERMRSAPLRRNVALLHSSVMSNMAQHNALLPMCPRLSLPAITEGDVIAWHDEIVCVKVCFIQAKRFLSVAARGKYRISCTNVKGKEKKGICTHTNTHTASRFPHA